jgi:transaldolase
MASSTATKWNNDSAQFNEIEQAMNEGAVGVTTNPPLTYQLLTTDPERFSIELEAINSQFGGDDKVVELIKMVIAKIARKLKPLYESSGGEYGYVRAQVKPRDGKNRDAMLAMGRAFASVAKNIKVKIPGTAAGIWVLEELASLGIPTNPTVCVSISQIIASAEAYERGVRRAVAAGIEPAPSSAAIVMGRLQDYLMVQNEQLGAGLSVTDLENACLATVKRCYGIMQKRGYSQVLMPAAFRCARQVAELVGAKVEMTIHPKIQTMVNEAYRKGDIKKIEGIDESVDEESVDRVLKAIPDFRKAYDPDGLCIEEFDDYGATIMTLDGFDKTGWQKLLTI